MNFETGDLVSSPLFGKGIVIESYGSKVIVDFQNKAYGLRTVSKEIFESDKKRLTKKKDIRPDLKEIYFNEIHDEYSFIPNDML